jgi:PIN domain nuclease of toxin-antitoxin system
MTRLLVDTHVFLWFLAGDQSLSARWRSAICDPANEVYLSVASTWEAVIKYRAGKLPLPHPPEDLFPRECSQQNINSLLIDEDTIRFLARLPSIHKDPFDRILIAQALQHDLTLITVDVNIRSYPVKLLAP